MCNFFVEKFSPCAERKKEVHQKQMFFLYGGHMNKIKPAPSDTVAVLFCLTSNRFFASDNTTLTRALFHIRHLSPSLQTFTFSQKTIPPRSEQLNDALVLLRQLHIIKCSGKCYYIDDAAHAFVMQMILPKFSQEEKDNLRTAASLFKALCAIEPCEDVELSTLN